MGNQVFYPIVIGNPMQAQCLACVMHQTSAGPEHRRECPMWRPPRYQAVADFCPECGPDFCLECGWVGGHWRGCSKVVSNVPCGECQGIGGHFPACSQRTVPPQTTLPDDLRPDAPLAARDALKAIHHKVEMAGGLVLQVIDAIERLEAALEAEHDKGPPRAP